MAEDSDVEKTEPASAQRLEKAREEGQVARSRELNTCLMLLAGAGMIWGASGMLYDGLIRTMRSSMTFEWNPKQDQGDSREMIFALGQGVGDALLGLLPLFGVLAVVAVLSSVALGGMVFSTKALAPQFGRMNPLKGLGRMVSTNTWVELFKTLCKAALIGTVAGAVITHYIPRMLVLSHLALPRALADGIQMVAIACGTVIASLLLIALIDVPWQMFSHAKKLRMSKEEIKREFKDSDGDPMIKGRIRQQQREAARRRMMSDVPTADVVVTNPTHFSVALKYDPSGQGAPLVVAKGQGAIALKIREIATEARVPMFEAPPLARALYANAEIGEQIPERLFTAVAQVLAWVFQLRAATDGLGPMPDKPGHLPVPPEMDPHQSSARKTDDE